MTCIGLVLAPKPHRQAPADGPMFNKVSGLGDKRYSYNIQHRCFDPNISTYRYSYVEVGFVALYRFVLTIPTWKRRPRDTRPEIALGVSQSQRKPNYSDTFVWFACYLSPEHVHTNVCSTENAVDPQNYEPNLALDLEIADLINSKKGNA